MLLSSSFRVLHSKSLPRCEIKIKPFVLGLNLGTVPIHPAVDHFVYNAVLALVLCCIDQHKNGMGGSTEFAKFDRRDN